MKKYFYRKDKLGESTIKLEKQLGDYFAEKLEISKTESEYAVFLNELLELGIVLD